MSIASIARDEIRALSPYAAAQQVDDTIRLNANESFWTGSTDHFTRPLNRYPEIRPAGIAGSLASYYGVPTEKLLVTRGTSEAIDLLIRCFCRAGADNIVTTSPSFSMYRHYAQIQGAQFRELACDPDDDFRIDPEALLRLCDDNSRLIFLCSPNNPTGTLVPAETLCEILRARKNRSAVVIDEAYVEFGDGNSFIELLEEFDNLIVLRTLSKALAFAGARCGVVIGPPDVIRMLDAVQAPYAMATPVVECVAAALDADALQQARAQVELTVSERDRLSAELVRLPFVDKVWPSAANFLLVRLSSVAQVLDQARADRILLRWFGGELAEFVRITVGSPEQNDRLLASLQKVPEA